MSEGRWLEQEEVKYRSYTAVQLVVEYVLHKFAGTLKQSSFSVISFLFLFT
jgi:hypothetical protein